MGISPERAARDQADQVYYVPENMTYREWEKKCAFSKINQYKGSRTDAVDSTEVPEDVQKDVNNAIEKIEKDFPSILELVQNILFGDCGKALGENRVNTTIDGVFTYKIVLNKSAFSNRESLLKALSVDYLDGTSYNTDRIESLVAHELGHSAHHAVIQKRIGYHGGKMTSKMAELYKSQYDQILQEIYVAAFPDEDYPDITAQEIFKSIEAELGTMAKNNAAELIAQSFGNYYYGSKKSRIATKIVEWFKEELK